MTAIALITASVLAAVGPQTRIWGSDQNPGAFLEARAQLSAECAWEKAASTYDFAPGPRKQLDEETGLTYFGARYYDAKRARWISPDAAAIEIAASGNPIGLSTYAYSFHSPINLVDPDGNAPILPFLFGAGAYAAQRFAMTPTGQRLMNSAAAHGSRAVHLLTRYGRDAYTFGTRLTNTHSGQEVIQTLFEMATGSESGPVPSPAKAATAAKQAVSGGAEKVAKGKIHHLATNKNFISTARGGPWSPRFKDIFEKAGMSLDDALNKVAVPGHQGPHPQAYHEAIFERLTTATKGLSGEAYGSALRSELRAIGKEAATAGTVLNNLLTGN